MKKNISSLFYDYFESETISESIKYLEADPRAQKVFSIELEIGV